MVDHVVLKLLTEKSDLGWFHSIHDNRGLKGHQKGITLNKRIINQIWPDLRHRQVLYEAAKEAEKAARQPGGAGFAVADAEEEKAREAGHLKVHVRIYGPAGKHPIPEDSLVALQDKNWRLNGPFVEDPISDPARFDPVLQDGDLALIGFDGVELPTAAVVLLLAKSTADVALMADLLPLVSKGAKSMIQLTPSFLQSLANKHALAAGHIIRTLAGDPIVEAALEEIAQGDLAADTKVRARRSRPTSAEELAEAIEANTRTGRLGEEMVNAFLATEHVAGAPPHNWMWPKSAAHPYDFELLSVKNAVNTVIDAKSTTQEWRADFFISSGELACAASSPVPYLIYRLSEVGPTGAWLRVSDDIRPFAKALLPTLTGAALPGIRVTTVAVSPVKSGLAWSGPIRLPPVAP